MQVPAKRTVGVACGVAISAGGLAALLQTDAQAGAGSSGAPQGLTSSEGESGQEWPAFIELTGVLRDFREQNVSGGHADFEQRPTAGFGHYCGNVALTLGDDGKPAFTGNGWKVSDQWRDQNGRPICHALFDPSRGDLEGSQGVANTGGVQDAASFSQWFRDVPGVNVSAPLTLTLTRQSDLTYIFDDKEDEFYSALGGFFPVEDALLGNPGGAPDRNFHFTYELHTKFMYTEEIGQPFFKFIGDDDVYVYIDGKLVIDLGGVHSAQEQYVDLTRLDLEEGKVYTLDFFFAERHRTQSNFRIQTNLNLESMPIPAITAAFD